MSSEEERKARTEECLAMVIRRISTLLAYH
jgi:hypothetical protein